ncbi:MAG: choice-of-anchor D domain-containing protein [Acidobacteriaceae bacterium]
MTIARPKQTLLFVALLTAALLALPGRNASAQQITYYDFNTPQANSSQYSYMCSLVAVNTPLFCFNYQYTSGYTDTLSPNFISDTYPASIDPILTDNPPQSGTFYATQMTIPAAGQQASLWFSVPQVVANGFTTWFAFKFTPNGNSGNTADGLAFVVQNAQGVHTSSDPVANCFAAGAGPTALGSGGGCMGYGGIDNSLALEFDTFQNGWDPVDISGSGNDNHIAFQNCGAGLPNSPNHNSFLIPDTSTTTTCQVSLGEPASTTLPTLTSNPQSSTPGGGTVTLADGNVHQVVVVYSGPNEATPNLLQVFIDPPYVAGTHTPSSSAMPVLSGTYNLATALNLLNSGSANDSAYIGFTSATGSAFEQHELMAWTFTPHAPVQQTQPINSSPTNPSTTTFLFGTHNYSVTYPPNTVPTGTAMTVIATPISQAAFDFIIAGTPFAGAKCQVYDDTGDNCIVYNVSCTNAGLPVACPAPSGAPPDCAADPTNPSCLTLTTAYDNSTQPVSAGFLQGDPFYAPVSSILSTGNAGTINCSGECAVTPGQTVNIVQNDGTLVGQVTVGAVTLTNQFPFTSTSTIPPEPNGGVFLTSVNVQNIYTGYSTETMDGSTTGSTHSFSDFVATSTTPAFIGTQLQLSANNNPATDNQSDLLTAAISVPNTALIPTTGAGTVATGAVTFSAGATPICSGVSLTPTSASTYTATCNYTPTTPPSVALSASYTGDPYYQTSSNTLILPVNPATYLLNVVAGTGGTVTANNGQQPAQSVQTITATPSAGYYFSGWTGSTDIANPALASTTVTMNGPENITANFTPKTTPTITWTPASIELGYPLGSAQLNATANVAGTSFVYTPPSGTFITSPATGQTLSVIFTPSDTTHYNTAMKTVPLTVTPGPLVTVSPTSIPFGTGIYQGSILAKTVTITNTGNATLTFSGDPLIAILSGGNSNEFATVNLCPKTLAIGKSCTMVVGFVAGPFYSAQMADLKINDNAPTSPQMVSVSATVIDPVASFSANSLSFGTAKANSVSVTKTITLSNPGGTALGITGFTFTGVDPHDFSEASACPASLASKGSCVITVTFKPTAKGSRTATMVVTDTAQNSPQSISLSGTGN